MKALPLILALSACGPGAIYEQQVVVIWHDDGGMVHEYVAAMRKIKREGRRVEIRGRCSSACTVNLHLAEQVCVAPDARIGFHGSNFGLGSLPEGSLKYTMDMEIGQWLPEPLRSIYEDEWRHNGLFAYEWLTGADVHNLTGIAMCHK